MVFNAPYLENKYGDPPFCFIAFLAKVDRYLTALHQV